MAKLFSELKPRDTIYSLSIFEVNSLLTNIENTKNVLETIQHGSYITKEIKISEIHELEVVSTSPCMNRDLIVIFFEDNPFFGSRAHVNGKLSCDYINNYGFNYKIYSTNKEDLIETSKKLITAIKILQERANKKQKKSFSDALLKLENI